MSMIKSNKIVLTIIGTVFGIVLIVVYMILIFDGYLDHGKYDLDFVSISPNKQVAVVAKTSDREAMNDDTYFVLTGTHIFSPRELKFLYHKRKFIFATNKHCVELRWVEADRLVITCRGGLMSVNSIDFQACKFDKIKISYVNIPILKSKK